jgi:hypothetical protein
MSVVREVNFTVCHLGMLLRARTAPRAGGDVTEHPLKDRITSWVETSKVFAMVLNMAIDILYTSNITSTELYRLCAS